MEKYLIVIVEREELNTGSVSTGIAQQNIFTEINGKCILHMCLEKIVRCIPEIRLIVILPEACIPMWKHYCGTHNFHVRQRLVRHALTRFHSVRNALENVPEGSLVAIHDGLRPFMSDSLIKRLFDIAAEKGSAVPVMPLRDSFTMLDAKTLHTLPGNQSKDLASSEKAFSVQSPQIYFSDTIKAAFGQPYNISFVSEFSVLESNGESVFYTPGEPLNLKISSPEDFLLARAIINLPD